MRVLAALFLAFAFVACAPSPDAPPPATPSPPPLGPPHPCSAGVWGDAQQACLLGPGEGGGWAGCSMADAPPAGYACAPTTSWKKGECTCACTAPGIRWDAAARTCH